MRLGVCLYRLGRGDYQYTVAEMCGIGESTVCQIVIEVCSAIVKTLWLECIESNFPKTNADFIDCSHSGPAYSIHVNIY